ncbi:MAG: GGDEF domain-containing protein [Spirochaetaceae bacterium]|nr:GGDEF domain-containing protein [Spirochaetaceae bacterium]
MIRSILGKKEYLLVFIFVFSIIFVNQLSLSYINRLQKNVEVVNYIGILRSTTEKLLIEEMRGTFDNNLIVYIDSIIYDLMHDKGEIGLIVIQDTVFLDLMAQILVCWGKIKDTILRINTDENFSSLADLSGEYFNLVAKAAIAAETFADRKVNLSRFFLRFANIIFIIFIMTGLIYFLKTGELKKKSAIINEIAYVDALTQMPNRACCEIEIDKYRKKIPQDFNFAVFLFDMNNLKKTNDIIGRQGGDRLLAELGRILKEEAEEYGFVGRYGGDEFLGIFKNCSEEKAKEYIKKVNKKVAEYNDIRADNNVKTIAFATGYFIGAPGDNNLTKLINNADGLMYGRKKEMREDNED